MKRTHTIGILLLVVSVIMLALIGWLFYRDYHRLSGSGSFSFPLHPHLVTPEPLTVDYIRSWMTFSYVNNVFHLPDQYLKTTLGITDSHYPKVTIVRVAEEKNATDVAYLAVVKDAVEAYLSSGAH